MIAEIPSDWLKNYIRKFGGIMNIDLRYIMDGWWKAYEGLAGLMEIPDDKDNFIEIKVDDLKIFINKKQLDEYKEDGEILFNVHNYGQFNIYFQEIQ